MSILTAEGLYKIYGQGQNQVRALDGVSIKIERDEFVAVVGTSGSENPLCSICWAVGPANIRQRYGPRQAAF